MGDIESLSIFSAAFNEYGTIGSLVKSDIWVAETIASEVPGALALIIINCLI